MISLLTVLLLATSAPTGTAASPGVAADPLSQTIIQRLGRGLQDPKIGQWVTYQLKGDDQRGGFMRLAIVGKQKDKVGREASWLEIEVGQNPNFVAPLFQMKLLIASKNGLQSDGISRAVVAIGAGQPQEVDPKSLSGRKSKGADEPDQWILANEKPINPSKVVARAGKPKLLMTAAGTVDALPVELVYRSTVFQRYWLSKEIPVLQLAKIEIPGIENSLEVRDYGLDAKPMIHFPDPNAPKISLEPGAATEDGGTDEPAQAP